MKNAHVLAPSGSERFRNISSASKPTGSVYAEFASVRGPIRASAMGDIICMQKIVAEIRGSTKNHTTLPKTTTFKPRESHVKYADGLKLAPLMPRKMKHPIFPVSITWSDDWKPEEMFVTNIYGFVDVGPIVTVQL